jgi:hypothetical protein
MKSQVGAAGQSECQSPMLFQKNQRLLANIVVPPQSYNQTVYKGADHAVGGFSPSDNGSSIILFNALGSNLPPGLHQQQSHPKSRAISGCEEINEFNNSNRQSFLAEKIEQLRSQNHLKEGEKYIVNKLSILEAA